LPWFELDFDAFHARTDEVRGALPQGRLADGRSKGRRGGAFAQPHSTYG
jgi:hypothetical protein